MDHVGAQRWAVNHMRQTGCVHIDEQLFLRQRHRIFDTNVGIAGCGDYGAQGGASRDGAEVNGTVGEGGPPGDIAAGFVAIAVGAQIVDAVDRDRGK